MMDWDWGEDTGICGPNRQTSFLGGFNKASSASRRTSPFTPIRFVKAMRLLIFTAAGINHH